MEARLKITGAEWMRNRSGIGLVLYCDDAEKVRNLCDEVKEGKQYELKLTEYRKRRSLSANAYLWVLLDKLADVLDTGKEDLYRSYIRDYGLFKDFPPLPAAEAKTLAAAWERLGVGWFSDQTYAQDYDSIIVRCYYGSSVYTTKQLSRLLNHVIEDAQAQGIDTMTPDERALMMARWEDGIR